MTFLGVRVFPRRTRLKCNNDQVTWDSSLSFVSLSVSLVLSSPLCVCAHVCTCMCVCADIARVITNMSIVTYGPDVF